VQSGDQPTDDSAEQEIDDNDRSAEVTGRRVPSAGLLIHTPPSVPKVHPEKEEECHVRKIR